MTIRRIGRTGANGVDRDAIIDLYMNGRMTPADEQEFRRMLDVDPALRRAFETERAISGALLRDRAALPPVDPESRTKLLAALASAPVPEGLPSSGTSAGSGSSIVMALKGAVAVAVVAGIVAVGGLLLPRGETAKVPESQVRQERSIRIERPEPVIVSQPLPRFKVESRAQPVRTERRTEARNDSDRVPPPTPSGAEPREAVRPNVDMVIAPPPRLEIRTVDSVRASVTIDLREMIHTAP